MSRRSEKISTAVAGLPCFAARESCVTIMQKTTNLYVLMVLQGPSECRKCYQWKVKRFVCFFLACCARSELMVPKINMNLAYIVIGNIASSMMVFYRFYMVNYVPLGTIRNILVCSSYAEAFSLLSSFFFHIEVDVWRRCDIGAASVVHISIKSFLVCKFTQ